MRTTTTTGTPYARHKGTYAFMYRWTCYLYIPIYTRTYIGRGTSWYQPVIPVPAGTPPWQVEHIFITTKLHELKNGVGREQRWMKVQIRGLHRCRQGRNWLRVGGVRRTNLSAYPHQHTHGYTREEITIVLKKLTLWANVLGIFSQPPAHRRPLDTERCRRFAPTSGSSLKTRSRFWLISPKKNEKEIPFWMSRRERCELGVKRSGHSSKKRRANSCFPIYLPVTWVCMEITISEVTLDGWEFIILKRNPVSW